jgi:hypothetical protein
MHDTRIRLGAVPQGVIRTLQRTGLRTPCNTLCQAIGQLPQWRRQPR